MNFKSRISYPASRIMSLGVALLFSTVFFAQAVDWTELKRCRLVESPFNDGDSFMVECAEAYRGGKQNRFRLYFVDTAETDSNSDFKKERLKEQAAYWGSDDLDFALKMGMSAEQTVKKILRSGFTVYARGEYAPTMGRPRYYALIKVNGRWLDEILAEEGLARIYGKGTHLPDRTHANTHWARLRQMERAAKSERRNGWRTASAVPDTPKEPPAFEPHDATTTRTAWIYSTQDGRKVSALPKGTAVAVIAPEEQGKLRVRFKQNGKVYEGLCDKRNLE